MGRLGVGTAIRHLPLSVVRAADHQDGAASGDQISMNWQRNCLPNDNPNRENDDAVRTVPSNWLNLGHYSRGAFCSPVRADGNPADMNQD
jgi:hypothetical protein